MNNLVEVGSFSFPKPNKPNNEDFLLHPIYDRDSNLIFAIADGVGSTDGASRASMCAIKSISQIAQEVNFSVDSALIRAKEDIDKLAELDDKYSNSATTLTIVHVTEHQVTIGHVGDCRAYYKKDNKLIQITTDHTRYQELLDSKEHSQKKLRKHKERLSSIITKALTSKVDIDFDTLTIPIKEITEDRYLIITLMSDGAYDHWHKRAVFSHSTMNSPSAFATSLRRRVQRDPKDDFTCLSVKVLLCNNK
jgi:serine/threonine protein phosphatase PrpC